MLGSSCRYRTCNLGMRLGMVTTVEHHLGGLLGGASGPAFSAAAPAVLVLDVIGTSASATRLLRRLCLVYSFRSILFIN